jgi:hypothetical protein
MENFAYAYANSGVWIPRLVVWAVMLFGGFLYAVRPRFDLRLQRAVYFLLISCLSTLVVVTGLIYLATPEARAGEYFFWLIVARHLLCLGVGYVFGIVMVARSMDAHGTPGRWVLGFIPIANLALLFVPSLVERAKRPTVFQTIGVYAMVIVGLGIFGFGHHLANNLESIFMARFDSMPSATASQIIRAGVKATGLEEFLRQAASEVKTPIAVDSVTTLVALNATKDSLEYHYTVDTELTSFRDGFLEDVKVRHCQWKTLQPIVDAGAKIRVIYRSTKDVILGDISIDKEQCSRM